jgi:hypothetical protein
MSKQTKSARKSTAQQRFSAAAELIKDTLIVDPAVTDLLERLTNDDRLEKFWRVGSTKVGSAQALLMKILKAIQISIHASELSERDERIFKYYEALKEGARLLRDFYARPQLPTAPRFDENRHQLLKSLEWAEEHLDFHISHVLPGVIGKYPRTRKAHAETAERITFMMAMSAVMQEEFGKPYDSVVADLTDVIFDTAESTDPEAVRSARRNTEVQEVERPIDLKSALMQHRGLDLKISGGSGQSPEESIILHDTDPREAWETETWVLDGICRRRPILWRTIQRRPITRDGRRLEEVEIELKGFRGSDVLTGRNKMYFDIGKTVGDGEGPLPSVPAFRDGQTELEFPYEIGWLHFRRTVNNEPVEPVIMYGAHRSSAVLVVRKPNLTDTPSDIHLQWVDSLLKNDPDYQALGDVTQNGGMLRQDFQSGETFTVLALGILRGKPISLAINTTGSAKAPMYREALENFVDWFGKIFAGNGGTTARNPG